MRLAHFEESEESPRVDAGLIICYTFTYEKRSRYFLAHSSRAHSAGRRGVVLGENWAE